jgi:hypothetical protein
MRVLREGGYKGGGGAKKEKNKKEREVGRAYPTKSAT